MLYHEMDQISTIYGIIGRDPNPEVSEEIINNHLIILKKYLEDCAFGVEGYRFTMGLSLSLSGIIPKEIIGTKVNVDLNQASNEFIMIIYLKSSGFIREFENYYAAVLKNGQRKIIRSSNSNTCIVDNYGNPSIDCSEVKKKVLLFKNKEHALRFAKNGLYLIHEEDNVTYPREVK